MRNGSGVSFFKVAENASLRNGLGGAEPVGNVDNADTFVGVFGLAGAGDEELGVGVVDFEKRGDFAGEGVGVGDVVGDLEIDLLVGAFGDEIDFAIAEGTDVDFVTAAKEFDGDDIFVKTAVVEVFGAENGGFDGVVAEVIFVLGVKVHFALDVVAFDFVEGKGVTKIIDIGIDGFIVGVLMVGVEDVGDGAAGGETGDIVEEVIADAVEDGEVLDVVFLLNVAEDEGIIDGGEIGGFLGGVVIDVGAGKTAISEITVEAEIRVGNTVEVVEIFAERKWEDFDRIVAAGEESGEVAREEEGVGTGDIEVVFHGIVEAIDGVLEALTGLDFIDEDEIATVFDVTVFDILMEGVVFAEVFKGEVVEVDVDNIGVGDFGGDVFDKTGE